MTRLRKMMLEELQRGKPPTRHSPCALLSVAPANTGTERPARYLSPERSLALSKMWWANGSRRKTHRCRNPTSFSTASHCCSMRRPFRTQTFRAFRRAPSRCALPLNKSLPSASSAPPPAYSFAAASSPGHLSCSTAQIPPHSAPPSLPIQSP